jgi:hypothetical protein
MRNFEIFGWDPFGDLRGQGAIPFYYWIAAGIAVIVYLVMPRRGEEPRRSLARSPCATTRRRRR